MTQHKVKVTVIDKKLFPELQTEYCADPNSGMCPCYNVGEKVAGGTENDFSLREEFSDMEIHVIAK